MRLWEIVETEEFIAAVAKLPHTQAVADVMALLYVRLGNNAHEGEIVDGDLRVIKSNPRASHKQPAILLLYRLDDDAHRVELIEAKLGTELPSSSRPPRNLHP